jgi:hypothetical protein
VSSLVQTPTTNLPHGFPKRTFIIVVALDADVNTRRRIANGSAATAGVAPISGSVLAGADSNQGGHCDSWSRTRVAGHHGRGAVAEGHNPGAKTEVKRRRMPGE